jgi:SAM-dependent methyltransferase
MASTSYERISARYEKERGGDGRAKIMAAVLAPWLNPGEPVLDVGAGTGIIAKTLVEDGLPVVGLDISPGMLSQAHDRLPGLVVLADAQEIPFAGQSFDAVTFVWSLHHIGDPVNALREAGRVLRVDGHILVVSATPENIPDDVQALFRRLDSLSPARPTDWIERTAIGAGLLLSAKAHIEITVERSPLELVRQIEDRLYSPLWDLDVEQWESVVDPILDELRSLEGPQLRRRSILQSPVFVFSA